jgi:hypothetical protein
MKKLCILSLFLISGCTVSHSVKYSSTFPYDNNGRIEVEYNVERVY